jgi:hypothetical protein
MQTPIINNQWFDLVLSQWVGDAFSLVHGLLPRSTNSAATTFHGVGLAAFIVLDLLSLARIFLSESILAEVSITSWLFCSCRCSYEYNSRRSDLT